MTRMRSPNYPSVPLGKAIELIDKIHRANRTNVIDRNSAARDMGYSGLTGRSLKVLAALIQFGLLGKAGKGDVKVTQTAVDILHAIDPADKNAALLVAGQSPTLFKELYQRFPEGIPSENAIRSYLIQQGFADVAIGPAITAFTDTNHFLQHIRESESHGGARSEGSEKDEPEHEEERPVEQHRQPGTMSPPEGVLAEEALNKIAMNIQGDRVFVSGLLDLRGLRALERKIAGLKTLLATDDDLDDVDNDDDL